MKKNIMKWALMLALVATPFAFTSCGDDDDPQVPQKKDEPQKTLVKKEVTYLAHKFIIYDRAMY